mgnify:CR=1 FL=1|jgi:hypothetical protein
MENNSNDYLKYWRVIRYYTCAKYKLTHAELDMLLFLKSEGYFDTSKFEEFNELLPWDKYRLWKMIREGWIETFRESAPGRVKVIYTLSLKCKRMLSSMYRKLNGEEIPTSLSFNPMFKKNVKYSDKVYRNMIKQMNETIRQQRHQTPEE